MKKFLMAVAVLALGTVAFAGPNAGGTIFAVDAQTEYSAGPYCGIGVPPESCELADTEIDGGAVSVWKVYAAFPVDAQPRLKAIAFGITYDPTYLYIVDRAPCDLQTEIPTAGWPGPGTGTSVLFATTHTDLMTEIYWFAGYNYYGAALFQLIGNPDQGGMFADDGTPSLQDAISAYGSLGFDMPGATACPGQGPVPAACCFPDGHCAMLVPEDCAAQGGAYFGGACDPNPCPPPPLGACCIGQDCTMTYQVDCTGNWYPGSCDPNPCIVIPVRESTWGKIKSDYR